MQQPEKLLLAQHRKNKGFLLLEVLISIIIIATTLIIINRAFSASLKAVKLSGDYLTAMCVLEDKIFDLQIEESFSDGGVTDIIQLDNDEFFYSMNISVADIKDMKDLDIEELGIKQAGLSVNWNDAALEADNISRLSILTYVWEEKE